MVVSSENILRRCRFAPYRKGSGPTFTLVTWDTNRTGHDGKYVIGYRLSTGRTVIFEGEDFRCSPLHAIDSDEAVAAIMSFLTLRPGDTDKEYFADYTQEQLDYCGAHAEALACEVINRFGER